VEKHGQREEIGPLVLGGHYNWRLPRFAELVTVLAPLGRQGAFPDAAEADYWSSTGT
jgi:hypothetical protein